MPHGHTCNCSDCRDIMAVQDAFHRSSVAMTRLRPEFIETDVHIHYGIRKAVA
jgi:hypothetical protein